MKKKRLLLSKPKVYDIREVKDFSVNSNALADNIFGNLFGMNSWNVGNQGSLKFDYGMKTIRIAAGIDEAEAKYLVGKIEDKSILRE